MQSRIAENTIVRVHIFQGFLIDVQELPSCLRITSGGGAGCGAITGTRFGGRAHVGRPILVARGPEHTQRHHGLFLMSMERPCSSSCWYRCLCAVSCLLGGHRKCWELTADSIRQFTPWVLSKTDFRAVLATVAFFNRS
jgi:hypothetical protein